MRWRLPPAVGLCSPAGMDLAAKPALPFLVIAREMAREPGRGTKEEILERLMRAVWLNELSAPDVGRIGADGTVQPLAGVDEDGRPRMSTREALFALPG